MTQFAQAQFETLRTLVSKARHGLSVPVEGVLMMRFDAPTDLTHELYTPVLCLVLQGAKQVISDGQTLEIHSGQGVVVNIEVPVLSRILEASHSRPYLALAAELDLALLDELARALAARSIPPSTVTARPVLALGPTQDRLLDCMKRLLDLADEPEAERILRPGIIRELHYLLLSGPLGATLQEMARPESHLRRIARATSLLRQHFDEPLAVARLAEAAGMSLSSFHQHFRAITSYSPRQFQKQLRLLEARRLMQNEGATARRAAFAVGYESPQQFTRDYAKRFGAPPRRSLQQVSLLGNPSDLLREGRCSVNRRLAIGA